MKKVSELQAHAQDSARLRSIVKMRTGRIKSAVAIIEEDDTLTDGQKTAMIKKARDTEMAHIIEALNQIQAISKQTLAQEQFHASKDFLLSRATFNESPSSHAAIALQRAQQLATMPGRAFALCMLDAKQSGDTAMVAAVLAARTVRKNGGETDDMLGGGHDVYGIEDFEIPGQGQALAAIRQIEADRQLSETDFAAALGARSTNPVSKLNDGRVRNDADKLKEAAA